MGCIESRQRKAAKSRSKRITEEIKREARRKKSAVDVLVVGTNSAGKETVMQQLRDFARALETSSSSPVEQCVTGTKAKFLEETHFTYKDRDYRILDLASEVSITMTKWIHCLENVNIIIFVLDISQYDIVQRSDPDNLNEIETGHVAESMKLFEELCNNMWFREKSIIIFLNNVDSFEDKLKMSPFSRCFPNFKGSDTLDDALAFIWSSMKDLDQNKDPNKTYKQISCKNDYWLITLNNINGICPVEEEEVVYIAPQSGICDESFCSLCFGGLWLILYCIYTIQCCCPHPRGYH